MRRFALSLILMALPAFSQTLTQHDREFAMSELHAARKMFLDSVAGLSQAQWNFKPAPDRWSIGQVAEHVTATEGFLFSVATDKVLKTPEKPSNHSEADDMKLVDHLRDRSHKASTPAELQPTGRWKSEADLVAEFKKERDRTIAYVETTQDNLRAHVDKDGMDAYQYLLFIAAHNERHVAQINEVKLSPGYPKQ